jgi:hypothetical protein
LIFFIICFILLISDLRPRRWYIIIINTWLLVLFTHYAIPPRPDQRFCHTIFAIFQLSLACVQAHDIYASLSRAWQTKKNIPQKNLQSMEDNNQCLLLFN